MRRQLKFQLFYTQQCLFIYRLVFLMTMEALLSGCSLYQSEGRKFLQDRAVESTNGHFQITGKCSTDVHLQQPASWPLIWENSLFMVQENPQDPNIWWVSTEKEMCQLKVSPPLSASDPDRFSTSTTQNLWTQLLVKAIF